MNQPEYFEEEKDNYSKQIDKLANNIIRVEGYVADQDVEKYFMACDLVVLSYISATQSGIVQMVYGFERPVCVTDVGGLSDVVENGKSGYVIPSQNAEAIARTVKKSYGEEM